MGRILTPSSLVAPLVGSLTDALIPVVDGDGGPAPFPVNAVTFDGTNDMLTRADLVGISDGKKLVFDTFLNANSLAATSSLYATEGNRIFIRLNTNGSARIRAQSSGGVTLLDGTTAAGVISTGAGWQSLQIGIDLDNEPDSKIYVDNVDVTPTWTKFLNSDDIDFSRSIHVIGDIAVPSQRYNGDLSETYFATEFLAFATDANREIFVTSDNKPAQDLTSRTPLIYLTNPFATWHINAGTGGNFGVTGALTEAATSPSD